MHLNQWYNKVIPLKSSLIIGQAKGEKWKHGPFFTSKLWDWFATIGITRERAYELFAFDALIDTGTAKAKKGRVPPNAQQIALYRPQLLANINTLNPKLIVPVGGLAVQQALNHKVELADVVGQRIVMRPFGAAENEMAIIPLPHPSGVSLWMNSAHNRALCAKSMQLIKTEIDSVS